MLLLRITFGDELILEIYSLCASYTQIYLKPEVLLLETFREKLLVSNQPQYHNNPYPLHPYGNSTSMRVASQGAEKAFLITLPSGVMMSAVPLPVR